MTQTTALLADAHPSMLEGIRSLMKTLCDSIVMVADYHSLIETADKIKPNLLVIDLSLPFSGKGNIVSDLRSRYPELKILVLSVHDEKPIAEEIIEAGANGYVLKRRAANDLIPAVEELLRSHSYISPLTSAR